MGAATVEEAIAFIQKISTSSGDSVFAHLSQLIQTILEARPDNAVDILETSLLLKQTRFLPSDGLRPPLEGRDEKEGKCIQLLLDLFSQTKNAADPEAGTEQEEEPVDIDNDVQNFLADSAFFEAVGVGLGQTESYLIVLALRKLGDTNGVISPRFFGKFFGTCSNYYVFETTMPAAEKIDEEGENLDNTQETWGRPTDPIPSENNEGTNAYVYWTCNKLGEKFYRLPDVTPLQIKTARSIKKFLTGNLNAEVSAYPPFPGVEENYLRAQIARISGNAVLAPQGYFIVPEPEDGEEELAPRIEKNAEWLAPTVEEIGKLDAWVHKNPHIKLQGRCSLYTPQKDEADEEDEEPANEDEPKDPEEEPEISPDLLTSIDNDAEISEGLKPWSVAFSSNLDKLKHQIVCVRSLLWPGAYSIATPSGFSNIYIGWGVKNAPLEPPPPPEIQKEYEGELVESTELPPIPQEEPTSDLEGEDGQPDSDGDGDDALDNEEEEEEE